MRRSRAARSSLGISAFTRKSLSWCSTRRRSSESRAIAAILRFIDEHEIQVLNVAGPRASHWPQGYEFSLSVIGCGHRGSAGLGVIFALHVTDEVGRIEVDRPQCAVGIARRLIVEVNDLGSALSPPIDTARADTFSPNSTMATKLLPLRAVVLVSTLIAARAERCEGTPAAEVNGTATLGPVSVKFCTIAPVNRW
jgi:hypothetical protein